jgi:plasmid stabilization system protein ParE
MPPVIFTPAAQAELLEARDWYFGRGAELAARFAAEIETVVERIAAAPQQFPVVLGDVRRARCRRFPYALFFRVLNGIAYVLACFHSSRDPRKWQRRT